MLVPKKNRTRMASPSVALRCKEAALTFLGAVGANWLHQLTPWLSRVRDQYVITGSGPKRLVVSLQFAAAVKLYHLVFRFTKRVQKRQLSLLCLDQLVLEFQREIGDGRSTEAVFVLALEHFANVLREADATSDKIDRQLRVLQKRIKIHWRSSDSDIQFSGWAK